MVRKATKAVGAATLALAMVVAAVGSARAVDSPKWVAALYVSAQKMIGLRWAPVPGATGYKVLRSTEAGTGYQEIGTSAAPQLFDKDIEPGTTYYYVLQAVAGAEASANSDEKVVSVPGEKKVKAVLAPKWKTVTSQQVTEFGKVSFRVGLTWEKSASPNVVAYNIYRSETPGKDYQLIGSVSDDSYVDATGEKDKTYYYVLSATDTSFQETPFSEEKSVALKVQEAAAKKAKPKASKLEVVAKKTRLVLTAPLEGTQLGGLMDFAWHPDEERIYCVDNSQRKIVVFDLEGEKVAEFGEQGMSEGKFALPWGIDVDDEGQVVVTDLGRKMLLFFKPNGAFIREFSVGKKLKADDPKDVAPTFVTRDAKGDYLVTDNANGHVLRYSDDGELLGGWGEQAVKGKTGEGYLSNPSGIETDKSGKVYVQDYGSTRVQVFDGEGNTLFTIGENVKGLVGSFVKVGEPFVDEERQVVLVPDNAMGNIQAFSMETGEYLYTLTNEKGALKFNERADWDLSSTRNILKDSRGRYWVLMGLTKQMAVLAPID